MDKKSLIKNNELQKKTTEDVKIEELVQACKSARNYTTRNFNKKDKAAIFAEVGAKLAQIGLDCSPQVIGVIVGLATKLNEYKNKFEVERNKAIYDELTGIYNRQYLMNEAFPKVISHTLRYNEPISVIMVDINEFKKVNDTYGHLIGDEVLKEIAQSIKECVRKSDFVARYGGDEFCVVCPATDLNSVKRVQKRIQKFIANRSFCNENLQIKITTSIGSCCLDNVWHNDKDKKTVPELANYLIKKADEQLYENKNKRKASNS